MFGRRKRHHDEEEVAVDATLELDLGTVEESIEAYLQGPSDERRTALLAVLERLDRHLDDSDAYESSTITSGALGYSDKGAVLGETRNASAAEEVPESVFQAQITLIKAAKREVSAPTPETLADLRTAHQALSTAMHGGTPPDGQAEE